MFTTAHRTVLYALVLSSLPTAPAIAAEPATERSYAIMSLVGNNLQTVVYTPSTGSNMNLNNKHDMPVTTAVFDAAAVEEINKVLKQQQPGAKTVMMLTRDPGLYAAQNSMFESPDATKEDRDYLKSLLKDRPVTHLILVTKLRAATEIAMYKTTEGTGRLEGLGFYMDNQMDVLDLGKGETGRGILAPFAYLIVRVVDAKTLDVVSEVRVKKSAVAFGSSQENPSRFSWNLMTAEQKVELLDEKIRSAVDDAIPRLLKKG